MNKLDSSCELSDEELYRQAKLANEESFPLVVMDRLLAGENPVKVFRSYRGFTQKQLAEMVECSVIHLSQIETGRYPESPTLLIKIATSLDVEYDDLCLTNANSEK